MYIEDFNSFFQAAEELMLKQPLRTRYAVKYQHKEGKLVLKVTDDVVCLKYKTDQQVDVKKMEKLNNLFFAITATGERPSEEALAAAAEQLASQSAAAAAPGGAASKGRGGTGGSSKHRRKG